MDTTVAPYAGIHANCLAIDVKLERVFATVLFVGNGFTERTPEVNFEKLMVLPVDSCWLPGDRLKLLAGNC